MLRSTPLPLRAALGLLAAIALSWACRHRAPTSTAPQVRIPDGCGADLSGEYSLAAHPDWRYLGFDDGGTLVLHVSRAGGDGGSAAEPHGDGGVTIVLHRTADGFAGATRGIAWPTPSAACPVEFPTEVRRCEPDRLVLSTVSELALDEACRPAPSEDPARSEVDLVRAAGVPPADSGS